ncbi:cell division protein ZapA [Aurantiacibacter xanthus]|uniref:Cell division protein ZapA n=1 Tax=Aurantiacibacter xanthus TaxID=1784712 RepID=A0A3A1P5Q3_9SPHN|nr:cell division protein ZapA [Aurantiacibacter xanthus]RIV89450.1 cell division protein ZapA [Aurantiacibacter xanthus]
MSNVTITISGRQYTVACGAGEEAHVERLGALIESKIAGMGNTAAQPEARMLLYAALLLADETQEATERARAAEEALAQDYEATAARLEALAGQLENAGQAS